MINHDKIHVSIKDFNFSISKKSGKITAEGNLEILDTAHNDVTHRNDITGSGFTVGEAFIDMLNNIDGAVRIKS